MNYSMHNTSGHILRFNLSSKLLSKLFGISIGTLAFVCVPSNKALAGLHSGPEYSTLTLIYAATSGSNWSENDNWLVGDACQWHGVACDQDADTSDNASHVIALDLAGNGLVGSLPSLSQLVFLSTFLAEANSLAGAIPDFSASSNISVISLSRNQFSGQIPPINSLINLHSFSINSNQLSGPLPTFDGMSQLQSFIANNNQLTGPIPELSGLTNLTSFNVENNYLTGTVPPLTSLTNLSYFYVANNRLSGLVPDVGELTGASLCPNDFSLTPQGNIDVAWDNATGYTPWWATPFASNLCDDLYENGFE